MADLYQYILATGVIVADTSTILAGVQGEYQSVFGADLIVTPDTPQGVLITAEALSRAAVVANNAAIANQINPNIAGGVFLDGLLAFTGVSRTVATPSVVPNVSLAGLPSTLIPAGSLAQTAAGDIFQSVAPISLDGSGNGTVDFQSVELGPIACGIGDLNQVLTSVLGWETVTNDTGATLGQNTQSDQQARAFRKNTLAFQSVSLAEAITSALYYVNGVTSLSFRENYNDEPMGMLISITGGSTLAGQIWGLTTVSGTGTDDAIIVGTDAMDFAESAQDLPAISPWPIAAFSTTGNISLSGLGTQGGGDWSGSLTGGQIVLVKNQNTHSQNGLWTAAAGAWARQAYNVNASEILGSNDGISMIANSVYSCVDGGLDVDVAAALLENKSSGAGWNGNELVAVVEPASGQTYNVKFDRPEEVGILVRVTTTNGSAPDITQAVLDYAAGLVDGLQGYVVGADVSPFEIAGAITREFPQYYLSNVEVSLADSISYTNSPISIGLNQIALTQIDYITVVIS